MAPAVGAGVKLTQNAVFWAGRLVRDGQQSIQGNVPARYWTEKEGFFRPVFLLSPKTAGFPGKPAPF
jgi:hypothetical protein